MTLMAILNDATQSFATKKKNERDYIFITRPFFFFWNFLSLNSYLQMIIVIFFFCFRLKICSYLTLLPFTNNGRAMIKTKITKILWNVCILTFGASNYCLKMCPFLVFAPFFFFVWRNVYFFLRFNWYRPTFYFTFAYKHMSFTRSTSIK